MIYDYELRATQWVLLMKYLDVVNFQAILG